ncbi:MAG: Lrp/AsnC family transcriptional regulator [Actinomycetota bacterium]
MGTSDNGPGQVRAYILLNTDPGRAASVVQEIGGMDGVDDAADVAGPYDVIVRASASSVNDLGKLVVAQIQRVTGVTRTLTCPEMSTM